jgi:tRNA nucleotidyltransferase (CCA-adding enzyme)
MPVYLAGGIVRDLLLKRPIKDLDLVVEGQAIRLARSLARMHGGKVTSHPRFGTATWELPRELLGEKGSPASLDLASARKESYPFPGSLPIVEFSGVGEDLSRRDFTINAMALRLEDGRAGDLVDPFGGGQDLQRGLLRVLHERSFVDDPTRMLRALRYTSRYGFRLAPETRSLVNPEALKVLESLSGERLRNELDLILNEEHPAAILGEAEALGLLAAVDPQLPKFNQSMEELLDSAPDPALKVDTDRRTLGYLFWLLRVPPDVLSRLSGRLAFDGKLGRALREGASLLRDLPDLQWRKASVWTARLDGVSPAATYAVSLWTAEPALDRYLRTWRNVHPMTSGEDLKRRGLEPGPIFKELLSRLLEAWLDGEVKTQEEETALLEQLLKDRSKK